MGVPVVAGDGGCSCDPAIYTSDCDQSSCTAFMTSFLFFDLCLLLCYFITTIHVEVRGRKKSLLWRIILPTAGIACLSKSIRLAILANPKTRHSTSPTALMFLYNTHLCMACIAYITVLFFWMRLTHDLVSNKRLFGKLLPGYIISITITFVFYYAQVVAQATLSHPNFTMFILVLVNGLVCFILAAVFLGYTINIWRKYLSNYNHNTLFYKTFVGAAVTSILVITFCIVLLVSNVTDFNTTKQYLIKHAIYEILFFLQMVSIPIGFVEHYYRYYSTDEKAPSSEVSINHSLNKSSSIQSLNKSTSENSLNTSPSSPDLSPSTSLSSLCTSIDSLMPTPPTL